MKCELCRHDNTLLDHSLCASCAEMVQRLIALKDRLRRSHADDSPKSTGAAVAAGSLR